jgi:site-specific recombinase XerD
MGRYPLRTVISAYMEANKAYLTEETLSERERKLRALEKRYEALCKEKPSLRKDPSKWTEEEVTAILVDTKRHGWSPETQAKELGNVQALLRFVGNGTMDRMRTAKPQHVPEEDALQGAESQRI